jgi:hypothetical protein
LKANAVWDLPNVNSMGKIVGAILNDWRPRRRSDRWVG